MSTAAALAAEDRAGHRDAVIHTKDLTKVYPGTDFAAVDKLNLDIPAGEIFGLLGPNGAGKTTRQACSPPAWCRPRAGPSSPAWTSSNTLPRLGSVGVSGPPASGRMA